MKANRPSPRINRGSLMKRNLAFVIGQSQRNQNQTHTEEEEKKREEFSRRTCIQFVPSYFKYCETQNRQQRFSQLQTDALGKKKKERRKERERKRGYDFTGMRANFNQMSVISQRITKGCHDFFFSSSWNFPLARGTPRYLRLCSPSFALCLPYKYSSRIKGEVH